ncbi:copper chaperone PCu(A)C [Cochlodiniinecator piscidefendens]|uniref:copper chaperone PCu(A)C n=1 Tax=Cochlodiniinecator piscidefendens TaxID=2715756 RepID=UPI0014078BC2|nr:copper chaperone PCu(A)C [Cochlodiniinecator piscidefendens]
MYSKILGTTFACLIALPAVAQDIMVTDSYARSANGQTGAAFMSIMNHTDVDDQLVDVRSDAARRVELHTHTEISEGVFQMGRDEDGFEVPAHGMHQLARGGDHVMFMGLNAPFVDGEAVAVTLVFENAGEIEIDIPIDLERQPDHSQMSDHSGHGTMDN